MSDTVIIICYGRKQQMNRADAIAEYTEGVMCCDGCEKDRYMSIVMGLREGHSEVDDLWDQRNR